MTVFDRRPAGQIDTRYVTLFKGKYPLLHLLVLLGEFIMLALLVRRYNTYYERRPGKFQTHAAAATRHLSLDGGVLSSDQETCPG